MAYFPHPNVIGVTPSNPTAIASATYQMCGLGVAGVSAWTVTPKVTGTVLLLITGDQTTNATAQTITGQLSYGTGAAPANAAAVTGTQTGPQPAWVSLTGILTVPFSMAAIVTGLTIGTAYWLDLALKASAGTGQATNLHCVVIEL